MLLLKLASLWSRDRRDGDIVKVSRRIRNIQGGDTFVAERPNMLLRDRQLWHTGREHQFQPEQAAGADRKLFPRNAAECLVVEESINTLR